MMTRDLSSLLWVDLETDQERIEFLRSGRAHETGIIAPVMVAETSSIFEAKTRINDEDEILRVFRDIGMKIELGETYSVKGQVAQLIDGVRALFSDA